MYKLRDINALLAFLEVAECGSINRAAGMLNVSQPALTRTIRLLEEALGQSLFDRSSKGVRLTLFGAQTKMHAQVIRNVVRSAERGIAQIRAEEPQFFHIVAVPMQPLSVLAQVLLEIGETENVRIQVSVSPPDEGLAMIERGECDMLLAPTVVDHGHRLLIQDGLSYSATAVYCGRHHRFADAKTVELEELRDEKWVLGRAGSTAHVASVFQTHGLKPPIPEMEIDDASIRSAIVERSNYLSVFQAHNLLNVVPGNLVHVNCDWPKTKSLACAIRLLPHTPLSWKIVTTFRCHLAAAGLSMPTFSVPMTDTQE